MTYLVYTCYLFIKYGVKNSFNIKYILKLSEIYISPLSLLQELILDPGISFKYFFKSYKSWVVF